MPLTKADAPRNRREVQMADTKTEVVVATAPAPTHVDEKGEVKVLSDKASRKRLSDALDAPPTPAAMRELAKKLPEKDEVQKETKAAMLADTPQEEVKHKVKVVDASPNADETPSGYALKKVAGIADNIERGEEYTRHKTAKRWGYVHVEP
jgi:hypothetical protein